ncbi:hypothetical protein GCK72_000564 [Caenorhabditis remanei]|uniref:Nucleoporin Nup159/Nup146 N-terminal domain-containing protein n=1 Tax=Caenorhabditis remanei TaxID=31234 RepID=A0A6A5HNH1_CAERE|nr:hypothetical protein GCK72_000564 [Caenorhabditis remanei]KAF1768751.1 hypothetical protein GCK72_000564 [Caenorhabditis remanei]
MSTDEVAQDVSQVNDFHFHTCRKFRLFSQKTEGSSEGVIVRNRLVTSSQLGVTFALYDKNQVTCFSTKSLLGYKVTRENMNSEVTDLSVKTIRLFGVESINDMGVNSDGTLLAILHTRNNDVSVDVFDIKTLCSSTSSDPFKPLCSTRVGTEQTNQGTCLEWNPAFPDTFAAASTDRSIMVAKINPQNPTSQKLIGIGKLGAITTAISWSPKGKQLTIGDSLGKIVQLKPELDVVRSQFGPDHSPAYGKVTGLCWLATTEWMVSFERGTDHDAYLMRCKKDKPTEWIQYHELSYTSSKWSFVPQLLPATQLLVDWNVVIVGNSKTSEISVVGKRDEWQTWVPVEGEGIYLPTTSNGKDTIPIGVSIDRSMTDEVSLKPDGSQKHRPSPLVLCLTNDGVLTAHHVISTFAPHKPCQIASQNLAIVGLTKLQMEQQKDASPAPASSQPVAKPSTIFDQTPKTSATPTNLFSTSPKPVTPLFGSTTPAATPSFMLGTPAAAPTPSTAASEPVPVATPKSAQEEAAAIEKKKAEALAAKKKILVERYCKMNSSMASTKDFMMKMSFAVGKLKATVFECAQVIQENFAGSKNVIEELRTIVTALERMSERTQHTVKEMDFETEEKMELVSRNESGERILEKLQEMSETEKLMRFNKMETAADLLYGKFEECNENMKKLRQNLIEKESLRKASVLSPLRNNSNLTHFRTSAETEIALKVMRNVSKIIVDTRERIQMTELEFVRLKRDVQKNDDKKTKKNVTISQPAEISILEGDAPKRSNVTDAQIVKARQTLVARIQKRGVVKTRDVIIESYKKPAEPRQKRDNEIDTSNLANAILKLSMTPRRVMQSSSIFSPATLTPSTKSDAATQADEPPIVKTVVVTVESPAKPIAAAPVVSKPVSKPATTTTTSSIITPKITAVKEEPKEQKQPLATSSSIFSGSLFGSKTPQAPAAKPSLFGTPEDTKPKVEQAKTPVIEEVPEKSEETKAPVNEEKSESEQAAPIVEEPKSEPPKAEEVPKVVAPTETPAPAAPVETNVDTTPKTPSFSFNTTPKSATSTPSIFGGGLKSTTPNSSNSSSIFGGAAQPTPVAAANTSSVFGGGAKTSPFGSFGATQPAQNPAPAAAPAVSFSFNTGASAPPKPASFGAFGGGAPAKPSSVFGASVTAPTVPNVDDGMEDDSMINAGGPGGFMSGLGNSTAANTSNSGGNLFAPKPSAGTTSSSSWLFGGGAASQQQSQQQQKPSFSFSNAGTSQQPAATSTSSVFGGGPKFGSSPVFGGKAFGGGAAAPAATGLSKNASIFGGGVSSSPSAPVASGGFAQFATGQKTSSLFGGGAAAATPQPNSSIFGGGAKTSPAPASSIFGGGASTNANKTASFTSWR